MSKVSGLSTGHYNGFALLHTGVSPQSPYSCFSFFSTHTACSSSLVATHLAHTGLLNGEASAAASCGIFMVLLPGTMSGISQLQALSPVGRCKTFEASGDGYGRGEGCTVAILQPISDADNTVGVALVRNTGVNQDGRSSSLTAPNGPSQSSLISTTLRTIGMPQYHVIELVTLSSSNVHTTILMQMHCLKTFGMWQFMALARHLAILLKWVL